MRFVIGKPDPDKVVSLDEDDENVNVYIDDDMVAYFEPQGVLVVNKKWLSANGVTLHVEED